MATVTDVGALTSAAFLIAIISLLHSQGGLIASADNVLGGNKTSLQQTPALHMTVQWKIKNDALILNWNYNTTSPQYIQNCHYIFIQEVRHVKKLETTFAMTKWHYIVVKDGYMREIKGLKPRSMYKIKVIAMSKTTTISSKYIYVDTKYLRLLKVYNLTATNITNTSALFMWRYSSDIITNMYFKLNCTGLLRYKRHNENIKETVPFVYKSNISLKGVGKYFTTLLVPNSLYTCNMLSVADSRTSLPNSEIQFLTSPGKPPTPGKPEVITDTTKGQKTSLNKFSVRLYESSNKFGPLSHYIVYAVPVTRPHYSPLSAPFTPTVPYSQLLTKSISAHLVSSVSSKLPFIVDKYEHDSLPNKISFNTSYKDGAFKPDTHYAFVVVVFSRRMGNNCSLHSMSLPSDPPVYIDKDDKDIWIKQKKSRIQHLASAALYTVLVVVSVLSGLTLLATLLTCLHKKREEINLKLLSNSRRNKENKEGWSSDEESLLYVKKSPNRKKQKLKTKKSTISSLKQSSSDNYHHATRVDTLKLMDNTDRDEQEIRLDLFSIATPPDSPCPKRPTSPLTTSHRSIHVHMSPSSDTQQGVNYVTSPVAAHVNYNEDVLAGTFTLPRSRPYVPPDSVLKSQQYYKVRTGNSTTKMPDPEPPRIRSQSSRKKSLSKTDKEENITVQVFGQIEDKFVDENIHLT